MSSSGTEKSQSNEVASAVQQKLLPVNNEKEPSPPVSQIDVLLVTPKREVKSEHLVPTLTLTATDSQDSSPAGSYTNPFVVNDNESDDDSVVDMTSTTSNNFVIEVDGQPHVLISGKPYPKKLIDDLDDDASAVALYHNGNIAQVFRTNETVDERRVRRLNKRVSKRILAFVEHVRNWVDALSTEHRLMHFSDKRWAFEILPSVAHEIKEIGDLLVATGSERALLTRVRSVEDKRTAHFLKKFSNHDGRPYKMAPKGNLMKRSYLFFTEFCLQQEVEY